MYELSAIPKKKTRRKKQNPNQLELSCVPPIQEYKKVTLLRKEA